MGRGRAWVGQYAPMVAMGGWALLPLLAGVISHKVVSILGLTALAVLIQKLDRLSWKRWDSSLGLGVLVWALWAFLSVAWSPEPLVSFARWLSLLPVLAMGWGWVLVFRTLPNRGILQLFVVSFYAAACILSVRLLWLEFFQPPHYVLAMSKLNPAVSIMGMMAIPFIQLQDRWNIPPWQQKVLFATALGTIFLSHSETTALGIFLAAIAGGLVYRWKRTSLTVLLVGIVGGLLAAPWIAKGILALGLVDVEAVPHSLRHRVQIWGWLADVALEAPLLGHGLNFGCMLEEEHVQSGGFTVSVTHPHNAVLQLWLEFGLLGVLFAAGGVVALFRKFFQESNRKQVALMAAQTLLGIVLSCSAYGLWQTWWLLTIVSTAAMSYGVGLQARSGTSPPH